MEPLKKEEHRSCRIPFSCPVCGRKTEYAPEDLTEGAVIVCSFCKLTLRLHGHMLQEVQREIEKLTKR